MIEIPEGTAITIANIGGTIHIRSHSVRSHTEPVRFVKNHVYMMADQTLVIWDRDEDQAYDDS